MPKDVKIAFTDEQLARFEPMLEERHPTDADDRPLTFEQRAQQFFLGVLNDAQSPFEKRKAATAANIQPITPAISVGVTP